MSSTLNKVRQYFGYTTGAIGAGIGEAIGGTPGAIIGGLAGTAVGAAIQPGKRNQKLKAAAISGAGALAVGGSAAIAKAASGQNLSDPISLTKIFEGDTVRGGTSAKLPYSEYKYDSLGRQVVNPSTGAVLEPGVGVVPGVYTALPAAAGGATTGGDIFSTILGVGGKVVSGVFGGGGGGPAADGPNAGLPVGDPLTGFVDPNYSNTVGVAIPTDGTGVGGASQAHASPSWLSSPVTIAAGFILLVLVLR